MILSVIDIAVMVAYLTGVAGLGWLAARRSDKTAKGYFLGANRISWPALGLSNAAGMFDISGTMWMVYLLFVYGLKSIFIPWLWPSFNQVFLMVFLSLWLRRSSVMTGAQWIEFRFGQSRAARYSQLIVVAFALISVLGFLAYGFVGIGKFASAFLPWTLHSDPSTNAIYYGGLVTLFTALYMLKGGMLSVVYTEILQFIVMTLSCLAVGIIAIMQVTPAMLEASVPHGWTNLRFGWELELNWQGILPQVNEQIATDGYSLFSLFLMLAVFKGILQSLAGPAPNYDMQRILSARSPGDAARMSGLVSAVLLIPRYLFITGLTVLALVYLVPGFQQRGGWIDFESILPFAMANFVPSGLLGLIVAGLLATFMSTFAATTNAAPAYIINDVYEKYINPNATEYGKVKAGFWVSVLFIIGGATLGMFMNSLNHIIMWLGAALFGGYTAANLLKWYWWGFSAAGYCWGMMTGMSAALIMMFTDISALYGFPFLFAGCLVVSIIASLISGPDDMSVLIHFYRKTRPWGWWGPVHRQALKQYPTLEPNRAFKRDSLNVGVGLIWHTSLTAAPVLLVIQQWLPFSLAAATAVITSAWLKYHWWDHLQDWPHDLQDE